MGPHSKIRSDISGGTKLGSIKGQSAHIVQGAWGSKPHTFRDSGQVGQESHRRPAVVETPSGVSGGTRHHRHLPLCPTLPVALGRRLSPGVAGHWGTYWGSCCFRGGPFSCSEYPRVGDLRPSTPDLWLDPAAVPRRASTFSVSPVAAHAQV
jgi:hypothetical protein